MITDGVLDVAPSGTAIWVPALLIVVGILGIVVPVVPGLLVALVGVLIWAFDTGGRLAWTVFALCCVFYAAGLIVKFLVPGRSLKRDGVGSGTLLLAVLFAVVGLFVVPIVGAPLGFVLGIYLVERVRAKDGALAWTRTKQALKAVAKSMGIELVSGLLIAATWAVGAWISWSQTH